MGAAQQMMFMTGGLPLTRSYSSGTSATETAPAGATNVIIAVWGGGAEGAEGFESGGAEPAPRYGHGGGAGGYSQTSVAISSGQTLVYTVGGNSSCSSGTKTITTMTDGGGIGSAGGTATGGTTTNTTGGAGNINGTGGTAVVGWNGLAYGAGGNGGYGPGDPGISGGTGRVIFHYT